MGLLMPKKTKYRRLMDGVQIKGLATRGQNIDFGEYGLRSEQKGLASSRQLEAARKAVTHYTKRGGRLWIRPFPHKPLTRKPNEVRMGSGKGAVDHYVAVIKPGQIIFEMGGVEEDVARAALRLAGAKLPFTTKFVKAER